MGVGAAGTTDNGYKVGVTATLAGQAPNTIDQPNGRRTVWYRTGYRLRVIGLVPGPIFKRQAGREISFFTAHLSMVLVQRTRYTYPYLTGTVSTELTVVLHKYRYF